MAEKLTRGAATALLGKGAGAVLLTLWTSLSFGPLAALMHSGGGWIDGAFLATSAFAVGGLLGLGWIVTSSSKRDAFYGLRQTRRVADLRDRRSVDHRLRADLIPRLLLALGAALAVGGTVALAWANTFGSRDSASDAAIANAGFYAAQLGLALFTFGVIARLIRAARR